MNFAAPIASHALVGARLAGRYRLVRWVREDAESAVFEASDEEERALSLRVMRRELVSDDALSRFIRAASAMAASPNARLVAVLDVGHDLERDLVFVVTPLLRGEDLSAVLKRVGPLAPDVAVRLMIQAADAVSAAHALAVVHRDVKPSTLFVDEKDGAIRLILADFGIGSRSLVDGRNVDRRTDVYRLGATMFELLSGGAPDGASSVQDLAPWVDPSIAAIVARAMSRDPEQRFPTADAFASRLRAVVGGDDRVDASMLVAIDPRVKQVVAERLEGRPHAFAPTVDSHEAAAVVVVDPLIGHRLGGRYVVKRLLGHGGMGAVYEVEGAHGARYAAKVILRDIADQNVALVARFLREGRAVTRIQSLHVTRTIELGTDIVLGVPFIVMELLEGRDLGAVMRERGAIEAVPLLRVFLQAARGLSAAHAEAIIHRDVKPANIFLHASEGRWIAKICDFGLAKATEAFGENTSHELTRSGGMLGTPYYMSPEHAQNAKTVDARTDVWSLAASLFEGLTGRKLWSAHESLGELIAAICAQPVPSLREVAPALDPAIADVVDRGLRRDLSERFASMDAFIAALEPLVGGREDVVLDELKHVEATRLGAPMKSPRAESWAPRAHTLGMQETALAAGSVGSEPRLAITKAPKRGWWGYAAAAMVAAAVTAGIVGVRRNEVVAVRTVDALSPDFGSTMSSNAQAVAAYHAGMQAFRDGAGDMAREKLEKAAEIDPAFAAAHLRRVVLSLFDDPSRRAHATEASHFRGALSEHDQALLNAYEPWVASEPKEAEKRLSALALAHPGDADFAYHSCRIRLFTGEYREAQTACAKALQLDPGLVDARHLSALAAESLGDTSRAITAYSDCFGQSRLATSCLAELVALQLAEGRCSDALKTARTWVDVDPGSALAHRALGNALFGAGEPPESAREALEHAWDRMDPELAAAERARGIGALAIFAGNFSDAEAAVRVWEGAIAKSTDEWPHLGMTLWAVPFLMEEGRSQEALQRIDEFFRRRPAWSATPPDLGIYLTAARLQLGAIDRAQWTKARDAWLSTEQARPTYGVNAPSYYWSYAYAYGVSNTSSAREAIDALARFRPMAEGSSRGIDFDEVTARVFLYGDRPKDAIEYASRATRSCSPLDAPIESTLAEMHLGDAFAATGSVAEACNAYSVVLKRWGTEKKSLTAARAREASAKLGCGR